MPPIQICIAVGQDVFKNNVLIFFLPSFFPPFPLSFCNSWAEVKLASDGLFMRVEHHLAASQHSEGSNDPARGFLRFRTAQCNSHCSALHHARWNSLSPEPGCQSHPPLISAVHLATNLLLFRRACQLVPQSSAFTLLALLTPSFLLVLLLNVSHTSRHGCPLGH